MEENTIFSEDIFEDTNSTEPEREPENENEPEREPENEPEGEKAEQTIRVKYNGEEKDVPISEAQTLIQKGMNYDKVNERLTNSKELQLLEHYARMNGMSRQQYVDFLEKNKNQAIARREAESLKQKYPDLPDDVVREMGELKAAAEEKRRSEEEQARVRSTQEQMWREFVESYPDIKKGEDIPAEVREEIDKGKTPVEAMRQYELATARKEIEDLKLKLAAFENNKRTKEKAPGKMGGSGETESDPFLSGLFD